MNVNSEIYITDNVIWFHSLCLKFCIKKKSFQKVHRSNLKHQSSLFVIVVNLIRMSMFYCQ
jgi:hypothetical protein